MRRSQAHAHTAVSLPRRIGRALLTPSSASFQDTGALIFDVTKRQSFNVVVDMMNVFNHMNFKLTSATLPNKLGLNGFANQMQPG